MGKSVKCVGIVRAAIAVISAVAATAIFAAIATASAGREVTSATTAGTGRGAASAAGRFPRQGGLGPARRLEALFYMTRGAKSVQSFEEHANKIDAIVPTWYSVDRSGRVSGHPDPAVLKIAEEHRVAVMPIVSAWDFHPATYHAFLNDRRARQRFGQALVEACRRYGYGGFQIDFEDINWLDRDALTSTVAEAATALHRAGYEISIATVPNAPGLGSPTAFGQWLYHHWGGAYDLAALGKSVDLICLMTYDEHTRFTPPGPVAGYPWTVEQLNYALQQVPKRKLSLGIPLYGYHWWAGKPFRRPGGTYPRYWPNVEAKSLSALQALRLAMAYHRLIQWDPTDQASWFDFYHSGQREWVFFTDARTFETRLNLARQRGLEGFCAWVLGDEDPGIWKWLPRRRRTKDPAVRGSRGIRNADFRNFIYPSQCWRRYLPGFDELIPVKGGIWKKAIPAMPGAQDLFRVESVSYGNLGTGQPLDAVVHTACSGPANWQYNEVFVFGLSPRGPKLLARLSPHDWGASEQNNGSFFQIAGVRVLPKQLRISFYAGGSHARPARLDTAVFQWQGHRFVRTKLARSSYVPSPPKIISHPSR